MVDPATTILGGIVGAIIGLLWSDPYRDRKGRYTTRKRGYENWIFQAAFGAILGAIVTPMVLSLIASGPIVGIAGVGLITYFMYRKEVDPR